MEYRDGPTQSQVAEGRVTMRPSITDEFPELDEIVKLRAAKTRRRISQDRQTGEFLKGPLPWAWLEAAARLPGRTLHVGIILWHLSSLTRNRQVTLSRRYLDRFEISRHIAYRALVKLEGAGLVAVQRCRGRRPVVSILETPKVSQ